MTENTQTDTEIYNFSIWNIAPSRWVELNDTSYSVNSAEVVGEKDNEEIQLELEVQYNE